MVSREAGLGMGASNAEIHSFNVKIEKLYLVVVRSARAYIKI